MPRYKLTDPTTGKTVTVSGDKPPTQNDVAQIFQATHGSAAPQPDLPAGLTRDAVQPSAQDSQPQPQGFDLMKTLGSLGQTFTPQNTKAVTNLPSEIAAKAAARPDARGNLGQAIVNSAQSTVDLAKGTVLNPKLAAEDTSLLLNGGKKLLSRLLLGAISGGLSSYSRDDATVGSTVEGTLLGGGLNGLLPPAARVLANNPVTRAIQAPFKGQINSALIKGAEDLGIKDLPVSAQSKSAIVKQGEAFTEKTVPIIGGKISAKLGAVHDQLDKKVEELTQTLVKSPDFHGTGEKIVGGFKDFTDTFNKHKTELYDRVSPSVMSELAQPFKTVSALQSIIDEGNKVIGSGSSDTSFFKSILDGLVDDVGKFQPVTNDEIKATRSFIGGKKDSFTDVIASNSSGKGQLKRLYAALSEDLDSSISHADKAMGTALKEANAYYSQGINKIKGTLGKKIQRLSSNPEKLVDELVKPNSETTVAGVRDLIGDESFKALQESFLSKLYTNSVNAKSGLLDTGKIESQFAKYGEPTLKKLLDPEQYDRLISARSQLKKIADVKTGLRNPTRDGSQTAFIGAQGALSVLSLLHPSILAGYVLNGAVGHGLFNTKMGNKYLTEGLNVANPVGKFLESATKAGLRVARPLVTNGITPQDNAMQRAQSR